MTSKDAASAAEGRILVVCTGNVCRSPYAERRLRAGLADNAIGISSAGTAALTGQSMEASAADLLQQAGGNAGGFVARQLDADMVLGADLVLCATRAHRTAVARLAPKALRRAFAILDFADLARVLTMDPPPQLSDSSAGDSLVHRVVAAALLCRGDVEPRDADGADVTDPFGRSPHVFAKMAHELDPALDSIMQAIQLAA